MNSVWSSSLGLGAFSFSHRAMRRLQPACLRWNKNPRTDDRPRRNAPTRRRSGTRRRISVISGSRILPMRARLGLVIILCSPLIWNSVLAQEPQDTPGVGSQPAITTSDPEIPVSHLDLLLDPLTRNELLVEAGGWRDLVKAKVREISAEEIATRDKTKEIDQAQAEPSAAAPEAAEQQQQKQKILDRLTKLREVVRDQGVDYFKGRRPQMGYPAASVNGHYDRFRDSILASRGRRSQGDVEQRTHVRPP